MITSNGTRGNQRCAQREEHEESLPGVRAVHQQYQPAELKEGQQLRGHPQQELGLGGLQAAGGPSGCPPARED